MAMQQRYCSSLTTRRYFPLNQCLPPRTNKPRWLIEGAGCLLKKQDGENQNICPWLGCATGPGTHRGSHHSLGESSRQGNLQGALHKVTRCLWDWLCILSSLIWFFRSQCSRQSSLLMYISHARFRSPLFGQSSMETPPMISEMESDWIPALPSWSGECSLQLTHCWTVGKPETTRI